jgi:hypothetical protein
LGGSRARPRPAPAEGPGEAGSGELEERLRILEKRMEDAAAALGSRRD